MKLLYRYQGEVCATGAGIGLMLAFSPFDGVYLAPIALSVLFATCLSTSPKRAFFRGYLFGLGQFLGVSWVYVSIHDFGGANTFFSLLISSLFISFWAVFPGIFGFLSGLITQKNRLLFMPILWILIEYLRGSIILNGFPWLQLAYSQLDTPLSGFIPLLGAYGTGFIVAVTSAIILLSINNKKYPLLITIVLLWGTGGILKTISWTAPRGKPFQVALIQGNISQDQKWLPENRLKTLALYKNLTEKNWDANLIVWPESSIPAYFSEIKESFLIPLQQQASLHHSDIVVSLPMYGETSEKYNAVMTLGENNSIYRKQHLLPFGEYMPWQPLSTYILGKMNIRLGNFTSGGENQKLLTAAGYAFNTSICYEDAFGEITKQGIENASFLINVTNDGWFGDSIEPYQHLQIARMRALETGRYMLRATNTGATAIIAPDGKLINKAPLFQVAVLRGEVIPMQGITFYARLGDKPVIYSLMLMLVMLVLFDKIYKE